MLFGRFKTLLTGDVQSWCVRVHPRANQCRDDFFRQLNSKEVHFRVPHGFDGKQYSEEMCSKFKGITPGVSVEYRTDQGLHIRLDEGDQFFACEALFSLEVEPA